MSAPRPSFVRLPLLTALLGLALCASAAHADSSIVIQAEDALLAGPTVSSEHDGFRGTGFADFGEVIGGEYIEWSLMAAEEGFYAVSFRYALGQPLPRPLDLSVNGSGATVVDFPTTGEWFIWKTTEKVVIHLEAGLNTIRLTATSSIGANIDQIRVSVIPDPDDIVTYEAEEALLAGPVVSIDHEGYTGDGFADFGPNLGEFIEWTVNAPVHGFYSIAFRYALDDDARPLLLTLNVGEETTIEFPPTNAWTNWELTEDLEVELPAGENIIRATAANNVGANVDSLILSLLMAAEPENSPPTAVNLDDLDVPEGVLGAEVGALTVEDPNEMDEHTLTVSDPRFEVFEGLLKLLPTEALDHETEPTVTLDVTATDLGGLSVTNTFVLQVLDAGPVEIILEAEDGSFFRARTGSAIPFASGDGYLLFSPRSGAAVTWITDIPQAGNYTLKFRYTGPCSSSMRLRINGDVAVPAVQFTRVRWRSWRLWRTVCVDVALEAGENTIRLEGIGVRRPILDSLTILGDD